MRRHPSRAPGTRRCSPHPSAWTAALACLVLVAPPLVLANTSPEKEGPQTHTRPGQPQRERNGVLLGPPPSEAGPRPIRMHHKHNQDEDLAANRGKAFGGEYRMSGVFRGGLWGQSRTRVGAPRFASRVQKPRSETQRRALWRVHATQAPRIRRRLLPRRITVRPMGLRTAPVTFATYWE